MAKQYGKARGARVFYASQNAGKIKRDARGRRSGGSDGWQGSKRTQAVAASAGKAEGAGSAGGVRGKQYKQRVAQRWPRRRRRSKPLRQAQMTYPPRVVDIGAVYRCDGTGEPAADGDYVLVAIGRKGET